MSGARVEPRYGTKPRADGYVRAWGVCIRCGKVYLVCHVGNGAGRRYHEADCKAKRCHCRKTNA